MIYTLSLISFIISAILAPVLINFGINRHLYDEPTGEALKIHTKPIPYLGGIGIFIGFMAGLIMAKIFSQISGLQFLGLLMGSLIILFLGFWDDLKWKKVGNPFLKLFCQLLVGTLIVLILIKIGVNFHFSIYPVFAAFIAGFYIIGAMNAINMEDGIDGLAGGLTAISLIGFLFLSLITHNIFSLIISLSLLGAIIGFLIYNWPPASIFMGDNGSHFLGFLLALLAIIFSGHPLYNFKAFIGPIFIIGLPVIDLVWAIIRRIVHHQSPLIGDRKHLYDRIYQKGFSIKKTVLICYFLQVMIVSIGIFTYLL